MKKYIARYGREWERISDGKRFGNKLALGDGEKISGYREVKAAAKTVEPPKKGGGSKQCQEQEA